MFGIGQIYTPKLVEMVGENGGFDALWIDAEHAGMGMHEIRVRHDGRKILRARPFRPPAGHPDYLDHAVAGGRRPGAS